jgi:hypothetical protein
LYLQFERSESVEQRSDGESFERSESVEPREATASPCIFSSTR